MYKCIIFNLLPISIKDILYYYSNLNIPQSKKYMYNIKLCFLKEISILQKLKEVPAQ